MYLTGDDPPAGVLIAVLPFDPERVLDSLAAVAATPKPVFPDLEPAMRAFRPPDERVLDPAEAPWRALRDSASALADSLRRLDRRSARYAELYEQFRRLYRRLAQRTADRDRAIRALTEADRALADRARAAAESLRAWEATAYAAFPAVAEAMLAATGRSSHQAATDSAGIARFTLEPGAWWVVARYPHPANPFLEYYWRRPLVLTGLASLRLPLRFEGAELRWRH